MQRRSVVVARRALNDLDRIYEFVKQSTSAVAARRYLDRIERFIVAMGDAAERGNNHGEYRPGLRSVGFEGRAQIVFEVTEIEVRVARIFYGGENWFAAIEDNDLK
jgi:toxin ParE1/3/4